MATVVSLSLTLSLSLCVHAPPDVASGGQQVCVGRTDCSQDSKAITLDVQVLDMQREKSPVCGILMQIRGQKHSSPAQPHAHLSLRPEALASVSGSQSYELS